MEGVDTGECFFGDDDLLNFSLEEEDEETQPHDKTHSFSSSFSDPLEDENHNNHPFPEFMEEEDLEWLSNKDAFPGVETCLDILSVNPSLVLDHHSPVSVLENSNSSSSNNGKGHGNGNGTTLNICSVLQIPITYPVGKRSKRRRSRRKAGYSDSTIQQSSLWLNQVNVKYKKQEPALPQLPMMTDNSSSSNSTSIGRRCLHCLAEKTPQWRAGPMGPKTLCNACGVRYKSGRLVPEYRPASSPTFSPSAHSNSHRKIVEMRRQKQMMTIGGGMEMNQACGYSVG